ncbi:hypothetical protein AgCh_012841 [Apium graveolens]
MNVGKRFTLGKMKNELKNGRGVGDLAFGREQGRVWAVGGYVTPKQYFKLPTEKKIRITKKELLARDRERDEKVDKKTQALKAEIAELKAMMASGIALHSPPIMSKKASHQLEKAFVVACSDDDDDVDECVPTPAPPRVLGQRSCELSVNTIDNKVAFGMVYPGKDKEKVHEIDIPLGHKCVSVNGLLKPDVLLPVPVRGEMVTVRGALGSFLAWPEGLISYTTPAIKKKERKRPGTKPGLDLNNLKLAFLEAKPSAKVPKGFNLLYKHAVTWMKTTRAVLEFEMLGQDVLASYMTMHWILAIIWEGEIYFLNPLPHPVQFPDLEKALSRALKSFNSKTGRGNHKPSKAKFLSGSPRQPGGTECAYIVMRYMKEIINDTRLTFTTKWLQKTRMCYTEEQLDEVRVEALGYIQEHI